MVSYGQPNPLSPINTLLFPPKLSCCLHAAHLLVCATSAIKTHLLSLGWDHNREVVVVMDGPPVPCPRSPPRYPDMSGKRKELAAVLMLEREIGLLQEELKSCEGLQLASRSCKEVDDFVLANQDPLIPTNQKIRRSCRFWKWLCGKSCLNLSWICCFSGCPCSGTWNCCCCGGCPSPKKCCRQTCCTCPCRCSCCCCCFTNTSCQKCCKITTPSCPKCRCSCFGCKNLCVCFKCRKNCCNPCYLFY